MSQPKAWINAMRLRTLPLSLSGIIMGSSVAFYQGYWDTLIFTLAIVTTILFQILSNLANDLGDGLKGTDNKDRVGPERMVQSGAISPKQMKFAVILTSVLSFIAAGSLIYFGAQNMPNSIAWFYVALAILCILAAITYTVGKRAYGYHGMGDLMVLIFFGFVSVLGVYSLYSKDFLLDMILPAFTIGLLSTAVLNLNNMRDYANDAKSGKNTLVVKMGPNLAKLYHATLIIFAVSSLGIFITLFNEPLLFVGMLPAIMLLLHLRKVMQITEAKNFDPELKIVALSTFALSIFMFAMLIYLKPA
ncbi:MAG: 1,4-dihydroxy-2-naphthoate octaprenyltransferase [Crocinitomicaceae bacterium]|nr:1,4-dihydroxy-2-naphthoate octaprenyltransferase [Flavobacteriales bacterium]NQZ37365.1 1,4-dihydroxy-2-naphthoate octaprenyltransferase [Crocinitomicaceae bacterium]